MHRFEIPIRLQHTDAAGVIYFARLFDLAHLAFEDLLDTLGCPLPADLAGAPVAYPVVRASADFRAPLRLGQRVVVLVRLRALGARSFALAYRFERPDGEHVGTVEMKHAAAGRGIRGASDLPADLLRALGTLERDEGA